MKKICCVFLILFIVLLNGCSDDKLDEQNEENNEITEQEEKVDTSKNDRTIRLSSENGNIIIELVDNPYADALYEKLPMEVQFEDYNQVEKIAYLKSAFEKQDGFSGYDPEIGDLAYYEPWGNLSIFYQDFDYSNDLISLGKVIENELELNELSGKVAIEKVN